MTNFYIKNLISVIVPVYNVEKYLKQCVESILNQTYKNIEIILVDDGSTDKSGIICNYLRDEHSDKIKVIHKKNAGLGMARNSGLNIAKGEFITFIDSDDWILSNELEDLYSSMLENDVDYCKGGFQKVSNEGDVLYQNIEKTQYFGRNKVRSNLLPRLIGSAPNKHDSINMSVWGTLFKNNIIKENKISFPSERKLISEDIVFDIEYLQYAKSAYVISNYGYQYRQNPNSLTTSYKADRFKLVMSLYDYLYSKMKSLNYDKNSLLRVDRNLFINLLICIEQEQYNPSRADAIRQIGDICLNNQVHKIISSYPRSKLEYKQKIFLNLILKNRKHLLYYIFKYIKN